MSLTHFWIVLGGVFIVLEVATVSFGFIFVGLAGFLAAAVSASGHDLVWQVGAFTAALFISLVLLRPRVVKKLSLGPKIPSRAEALHGKVGHVTETIDPREGTGRVVVEGEDWAAESHDHIKKGVSIKVVGHDGIKLKVHIKEG